MNNSQFINDINSKGFHIIKNVFSDAYIKQFRIEVFEAIEEENKYHGGKNYLTYGVVTCPSIYGKSFLSVYENTKFIEPFNLLLGDGCIVYTSNTSCIPPNKNIFTTRIHVDSPRIIENYHTSLVGMVLLDDFTLENGATAIMPYSQNLKEQPSKEVFSKQSVRITGNSGDVCYFNPRLWHAGMPNESKDWRCSFLVGMVLPWMKQRIDIPRAMYHAGFKEEEFSQKVAQKLGYWAQVPANYDEFFAPPEKRKFKQKVV